MPDIEPIWYVMIFGGAYLLVKASRHARSHRKRLGPLLEAHGLALVRSRWPGPFRSGPFAQSQAGTGRPRRRPNILRGEYEEYRIVTYQDADGKQYRIWTRLEFEPLQVRRIEWRAEKEQPVPRAAEALLKGD